MKFLYERYRNYIINIRKIISNIQAYIYEYVYNIFRIYINRQQQDESRKWDKSLLNWLKPKTGKCWMSGHINPSSTYLIAR